MNEELGINNLWGLGILILKSLYRFRDSPGIIYIVHR
jgi:hypothetical protein